MKVLCVIDSLGSGGAQRQLVNLALGFKSNGHEVSFLTYFYDPFFNEILEKSHINITCLNESIYLNRFFKIIRFIRCGNYNAVLSFLEAPSFICEVSGLPFRKWRLVVGERSANPEISKTLKLIIYRWFHIFADYVVTNSTANLKIIHTINPFLSKSKSLVIYNSIDLDIWKPVNDYVPRKDGKLNIIVIASHQYLKNLNGLIEALSLLTKCEQDKLSIDWYGDGIDVPYKNNSFPEGRKKLINLGLDYLISFYPPEKKILEKIQYADVVGLFSFYEGLPNSVCEGMACGKPIICSAVSDLSSILSHSSKLLFDPSDAHSIAEAIRYLINLSNDQLSEIGLKNLKIAKNEFEKEKILERYLELISN